MKHKIACSLQPRPEGAAWLRHEGTAAAPENRRMEFGRHVARTISVAATLLAASILLASPLGAEQLPRFSPLDVFALEVAADPRISPDGSKIAYVRRSADIMTDRFRSAIWLIDTRSGVQQRLAGGTDDQSQPRWSNDGRRLAYVSSRQGGPTQLVIRSLADATDVGIAGLPEDPGNVAWSPDDKLLAFTAFVPASPAGLGSAPDRPDGASWAAPLETYDKVTYRTDEEGYLKSGFVHIFTAPSAGGVARQLTDGALNDAGPLSWTPDGRRILFSSNRTPDWEYAGNESEIYSADAETGSVVQLTSRIGADERPVVSPDGRWIAFTGYDDDPDKDYRLDRLYVMSAAGGRPRLITGAFDRSVTDPVWSSDSRSIYATYDDSGARRVALFDMRGSRLDLMSGLAGQMLDRPYVGGAFSLASDGSIAATTGGSSSPAGVSLFRNGVAWPLTDLNASLRSRLLGEVRRLTARSSDGLSIESWITLPPGYRDGEKAPLILEIHGGPRAAYGPYFSFDNQLYAAAGYAVLSVNPRGSTSYGESFGNLIFRSFPGRDYDDLIASVDAAVAHGYADPQRLFVTGGSAGGTLAAWIIGKTNRFRAAAIQKPIINMASFALTSDQPDYYARYWFGKAPWDDPQGYWRRSPLALAGRIATPALIIVGERDYRTPSSEAEQLYTALKLRRVPTALIKVPGANHTGLASRPSQAVARVSAILEWFRRYDAKR